MQTCPEMSGKVTNSRRENTEFDLPVDVVADQSETVLKRQYINLLQQGLAREQVEEQMEQLRAGSEEQAKEQLKTFFIMDKVAEELGIEVSDEELNGHIAQAAIQRGQRPEKMREQMMRDGSLDQFKLQMRENKCVEKLLESAEIREAEPEKKGKEEKTQKKKESSTEKKKGDKAAKKESKKPKQEKKTEKKAEKKAEKRQRKRQRRRQRRNLPGAAKSPKKASPTNKRQRPEYTPA